MTAKKIVYVTRRERFNAAHKLWNEEWSAEKNHEVFGKCAHPNWHGHNYELFVTVKGEPQPDTGYCVDLKHLSDLLDERVVEVFDHRNINLDVPEMQGLLVSTENIAIVIWEMIEEGIRELGCTLHKVELYETENNSAVYYGPQEV